MVRKILGFLFVISAVVCILFALTFDFLRGRPFSYGLIQLGLTIFGFFIGAVGVLILSKIQLLDLLPQFSTGTELNHFRLHFEKLYSPGGRWVLWGMCILLSTVYLLIWTTSSPLYPLNYWVDSNSFFTMGKGMVHGMIPYRDLFEQKGPLLYFLHAIGYLISNTSFLGIFFFEVVFFAVFLFYSHMIISIFIDRKVALIALPIISSGILSLESFSLGDSAEEFFLPMLMISLYHLILYFKHIYPKPMPDLWVLINGILAGCVLWIKFSCLGFWFGWIVSLIICMLTNKQYFHVVRISLIFLLGMFVVTIPWVVYFGINNSIGDWLNTYFGFNLTVYPNTISFFGILKNMIQSIQQQVLVNPVFSLLLMAGLMVFIVTKKFIQNLWQRLCLFLCIFFLALGVYASGFGFPYYFLIFTPFIVFAVIILFSLFPKVHRRLSTFSPVLAILITILITGATITISLTSHTNQKLSWLGVNKENLVQYKFAAIINQTEGATLLNYGSLDGGFYTVSGIVPNVKYFHKNNVSRREYPIVEDEQDRYIREKKVDFVVIRLSPGISVEQMVVSELFQNYHMVSVEQQEFVDTQFSYYLFEKIP